MRAQIFNAGANPTPGVNHANLRLGTKKKSYEFSTPFVPAFYNTHTAIFHSLELLSSPRSATRFHHAPLDKVPLCALPMLDLHGIRLFIFAECIVRLSRR